MSTLESTLRMYYRRLSMFLPFFSFFFLFLFCTADLSIDVIQRTVHPLFHSCKYGVVVFALGQSRKHLPTVLLCCLTGAAIRMRLGSAFGSKEIQVDVQRVMFLKLVVFLSPLHTDTHLKIFFFFQFQKKNGRQ